MFLEQPDLLLDLAVAGLEDLLDDVSVRLGLIIDGRLLDNLDVLFLDQLLVKVVIDVILPCYNESLTAAACLISIAFCAMNSLMVALISRLLVFERLLTL